MTAIEVVLEFIDFSIRRSDACLKGIFPIQPVVFFKYSAPVSPLLVDEDLEGSALSLIRYV